MVRRTSWAPWNREVNDRHLLAQTKEKEAPICNYFTMVVYTCLQELKNFAVAIFAPFRSLGKLYESACEVEQFPVTPEARITASR